MLEIKNLHVSVGDKEILKGLNLSIAAGQVHAIMGPNGSGKSTLSYVLAGRAGYDITQGSITYNGEDLGALPPEARAAKGVSSMLSAWLPKGGTVGRTSRQPASA